ncbi:MAG TPA: hypothetical protein VMT36_00500 [Candidatus Saccharimonadia bacterium]|nr:hypothetical protein [Candidatus Saccharimonadia bacterium]
MRRRLDVVASLIVAPPVLFLDEPTTGLDPRSRIAMWSAIGELVAEGTTVLLTTQYLDEADRLADQIVVLDHGKVVASGPPAKLKVSVGGERLDVVVRDVDRFADAAIAMREAIGVPPDLTLDERRLTAPVADGTSALVATVRALDAAGVTVEDIALRHPTLDEVFLALT